MGLSRWRKFVDCLVTDEGCLEALNDDTHDTIVLPNGITTIGAFSCSFKDKIETLILPESVVIIENNAFEQCENLTDIYIPNGVKYIGEGAFKGCPNVRINKGEMTDFIIWQNRLLGYRKIEDGDEVVEIPKGIEKISGEAFYKCQNLKSITIPGYIKTVGPNCFYDCPNLESVILEEGVEAIGDLAFSNNPALKHISIPKSLRYMGANPFGDSPNVIIDGDEGKDKAFLIWNNRLLSYRDDGRKEIIIPDGVKVIGEGTFGYDGEWSTKIVFPEGVTEIEELLCFAFQQLEEAIFPSTLKKVKKQSFINSIKLKQVILPKGVEIEEEAFPPTCDIVYM